MAERATETEFTLDTPRPACRWRTSRPRSAAAARGILAWRRMRRNYVAFFFLFVFFAIVIACLLAPVYAKHVAGTGPNQQHVLEKVKVNGVWTPVVSAGGYVDKQGNPCPFGDTNCHLVSSIPIGPTWFGAGGKFVLGADSIGRDVMVRLLYGGRTSLFVGIVSSLICTFFAVILALLAAYYGGWGDFTITRFFDVFYAFPVILLGIALGSALAINGFHHFGINIESGSIWIPTLVISYVLIPYVGRPLRGQVLSLRRERVHRSVDRAGREPVPRDVHRDPPEHRELDSRVLHADHRDQHPARGGALVPRRRRPAADVVVGNVDRRRAGSDRESRRGCRSRPGS